MVEGLRSRPLATPGLLTLGSSEILSNFSYDTLIEALRGLLRARESQSETLDYPVPLSGGRSADLIVSPCFQLRRYMGVQIETVFPDNPAAGLPARGGAYLLLGRETGGVLAIYDGYTLTITSAAATSALAASYLARPDCERLLVVGTGPLARQLVEAHMSVRPICNVLVWDRDHEKAKRLAHRLDRRRLKIEAARSLEDAVRGAHVITCATSSDVPLIKGEWLPDGVHVDLTGGVTPEMREADDDCLVRARVFVDSLEGTLERTGDIAQPIASGAIKTADIAGDLRDLTRGAIPARRYYDQITLFKSAGLPLAALAAAGSVLETVRT